MKTLFITAVAAITFSACGGGSTSSKENSATGDTATTQPQTTTIETKSNTPLKDVTTAYLQLKNGLVSDDGNDAASGGKALLWQAQICFSFSC